MSKISLYFNRNEAVGSATATQKGIANTPNRVQEDNIIYAASRMDLARELIGLPCTVNSWFRNTELNRAVGGVATSDHLSGLAIDFYTKGNNEEVYKNLIEDCKQKKLSYDQLIWYKNRNFIHISFKNDIKVERKMHFVK